MTESLGYSRLREEGGGGGRGSARREEGKRGERGGCNTSALMEGDTKYNVEQEGGEFGLLLNSVGINNTGLLSVQLQFGGKKTSSRDNYCRYSGTSDKGPSEIGTASLQRTLVSTTC